MTSQILTTLLILLLSAALLFSEKLRVDLVALLVLGSLALLGLVTPAEALSGFSNPAVVTVWAVFILSGGLARTGVAGLAGRLLLRLVGSSEARLLLVIMLAAGLLSGFMNNVGVAALLLPVVMHLARRTRRPPSKLLIPLAFASLLGGTTTLIGTPPNILASDALQAAGLGALRFFDFLPVGVIVMLAGILFMVLFGRNLLPSSDLRKALVSGAGLRDAFGLEERLFILQIPTDSRLAGKSLQHSRIGASTGLNVIGILRSGRTILSPKASTTLQGGDRLLVAGRLDRLEELRRHQPTITAAGGKVDPLLSDRIRLLEVELVKTSQWVGQTLPQIDFRRRFSANVIAILRGKHTLRDHLENIPLESGDNLLVQALDTHLDVLERSPDFRVKPGKADDFQSLHEMLMAVSIPEDSSLVGKALEESHLRDAYDLNVVAILRGEQTTFAPQPGEIMQAGDTLLVEGRDEDLAMARSLLSLKIEENGLPLDELESDQIGLVEVALSPQTTLAGRTLREIHFREKFGLNVLAVWREGRAYRTSLQDLALRFGDMLLIHGRRAQLSVLSQERDFLVLTPEVQEAPRSKRAPAALLIMAAVIAAVLLGWLPIAVAAVIGASLMILTGCLTMEEAYGFIEWKAVFLIAGMLPLGIAMEKTGTAQFLASGVVSAVGGLGPWALMSGIFLLTTLASQFMPNPVVTVLMAPVAINTASSLGVSPYSLMMVVAIAASAAFLSPVGHPANVLVMGPGGYRFIDYFKVGLPLTLVILVVSLLAISVFWPL